ncbi:integrase arm-type DNA-binding domain-containing protein [Roseibium sp.]|uniref:tyrosine-type recombinase/integrase n=1 Tax=Roseibium sp. TaxID=1936156 RepID=UPI0032679E57
MLTDAKIRKAKACDKPSKLTDSHGLYLLVSIAGSKSWRYRYRWNGKEQTLTIGNYPIVSLADARAKRDEARRLLDEGVNPASAKREHKAEAARNNTNTFAAIAREWHALQTTTWSEKHSSDVIDSLEREAFPEIGSVPIHELSARILLNVLRVIETRGAKEMARRVRQRMSAVFVYAIALGLCDNDPAAQVQKAMAPLKKGRQPAITTLEDARNIIRHVDQTPAHPVTKLAHRLLLLTATRPGTLTTTRWVEFDDLDPSNPVWIIPASRMKLRLHLKDDETRDHLIPLPRQAVETISALRTLTGRGELVFPNTRHAHKPMSANAIGYMLNRAGYHHRHVPHGWRATFSTVMNELRPTDRQIIDLTLAHVPKDKVESAYNRALHLKRRKIVLQEWADLVMDDQASLSQLCALPRKAARRV